LRLPTTEIKGDIDFITKAKKQKIVSLFCWCVVYLFLAENLYFESQTNRKLTLESKIALGAVA